MDSLVPAHLSSMETASKPFDLMVDLFSAAFESFRQCRITLTQRFLESIKFAVDYSLGTDEPARSIGAPIILNHARDDRFGAAKKVLQLEPISFKCLARTSLNHSNTRAMKDWRYRPIKLLINN